MAFSSKVDMIPEKNYLLVLNPLSSVSFNAIVVRVRQVACGVLAQHGQMLKK